MDSFQKARAGIHIQQAPLIYTREARRPCLSKGSVSNSTAWLRSPLTDMLERVKIFADRQPLKPHLNYIEQPGSIGLLAPIPRLVLRVPEEQIGSYLHRDRASSVLPHQ